MSDLEDWKLVEHVTVLEFALLEKGYDPQAFEGTAYVNFDNEVRSKIAPLVTALNAILDTRQLDYAVEARDEDGRFLRDRSRVRISDLIAWAESRGAKLKFFVDGKPSADLSFGNPNSPHYAPKLQAAVDAWAAVSSDKKLQRNTTPKGAIKSWLTRNAARYDLIGEDGKPSKSAIEAIAQVANWRQKGGAPTTGVPEDDLDF